MVFSSSVFLFQFLPLLLFLYYFAKDRYRNLVLLVASLAFYAWGEPKNIFLMLLSVFVNYWIGILLDKFRRLDKLLLTIAVIYNLGILYIFKYLNFSVDTLNRVTGAALTIPKIALPIGISFFTFQIMSYVIDVYRKEVEVQKNILDLALYISLFPQLIAGPIVRYVDVKNQIAQRGTSWEKFHAGVIRFAIGFSKKVLIADQLSSLVDTVFAGKYPSLWGHWVGILAYTLQIYFDFSGYSDMAIGMGKMFGFDFLENFNYPYISRSIKEFWRRWHISLSTWFRDYLYIPLGGSRKGKARTYVNLLIEKMHEKGLYKEILTPEYINYMQKASPLHDIGKITVPDRILQKPGALTKEEYELIQLHAEAGGRLIQENMNRIVNQEFVEIARDMAAFHHEKWNGGGYPRNLKGEEIYFDNGIFFHLPISHNALVGKRGC